MAESGPLDIQQYAVPCNVQGDYSWLELSDLQREQFIALRTARNVDIASLQSQVDSSLVSLKTAIVGSEGDPLNVLFSVSTIGQIVKQIRQYQVQQTQRDEQYLHDVILLLTPVQIGRVMRRLNL